MTFAAVRDFNTRFNRAQFPEIYARAHPQFRTSISEQEFTEKLSRLLQEHGPISEGNVNGFEYFSRWQRMFPEFKPTRSEFIYVKCRDGGFQEIFTFDVSGEEGQLLEFSTSIEESNRKRKR